MRATVADVAKVFAYAQDIKHPITGQQCYVCSQERVTGGKIVIGISTINPMVSKTRDQAKATQEFFDADCFSTTYQPNTHTPVASPNTAKRVAYAANIASHSHRTLFAHRFIPYVNDITSTRVQTIRNHDGVYKTWLSLPGAPTKPVLLGTYIDFAEADKGHTFHCDVQREVTKTLRAEQSKTNGASK